MASASVFAATTIDVTSDNIESFAVGQYGFHAPDTTYNFNGSFSLDKRFTVYGGASAVIQTGSSITLTGDGDAGIFRVEQPTDPEQPTASNSFFTIQSQSSVSAGTFVVASDVDFQNAGTISAGRVSIQTDKAVNSGSIDADEFEVSYLKSFSNNGTLTFQTAALQSAKQIENNGAIVLKDSNYEVQFGTFVNKENGTITTSDGTLAKVSSTSNFTNYGALKLASLNFGTGGNLYNSGTIESQTIAGYKLYQDSPDAVLRGSELDVGLMSNAVNSWDGVQGTVEFDVITTNQATYGKGAHVTAREYYSTGQNNVMTGDDGSFNVETLHVVNKNSKSYIAFKDGTYALHNVVFDAGEYYAEDGYTGIQNFNSSISIENLVVAANTNGMVNFYDSTSTTETPTVRVQALSVASSGTLFLNAEKDTNNELIIDEADFGKDSTIRNKTDSDAVHVVLSNASTDGLTIEELPEGSTLSIGNIQLSGSNVFNQTVSGTPREGGRNATNWVLETGASVAADRVESDLNISVESLEGSHVTVSSLGDDSTAHVYMSANENNASPETLAKRVREAVQIGEDGADYYGYVPEGALWDALTLTPDGGFTTDGKNSKLEGFKGVNAAALVQWRDQVNHITKRLGDVRMQPSGIGAWARVYGGESKWGSSANSVEQKSTTIQIGGDGRIGNWIVGAAFSYTDSDLDLDHGSGDGDLYGLAAYGSRLFDSGAYIDVVARYGRIENDVNSGGMTFSTQNNAFGISVESGHQFRFVERAYIEPQVELAYGFISGDDDNATTRIGNEAYKVKIEQDDYQTLVGRIGFRTGFDFPENAGTIYAHVSYSYDFLGDADGTASVADQGRRSLDQDLGGGWFTYGVGAQFRIGDATFAYADLERTSGGDVETPYAFNVGFRHLF